MLLFWITIPLMVLAVAWAVGTVLYRSAREEHRAKAEAVISGAAPTPDDGAVRMAASVKPELAHEARTGMEERRRSAPDDELWQGVDIIPTPGNDQVLITIPAETVAQHEDAPERIAEHVGERETFERVERLDQDDREPRQRPA